MMDEKYFKELKEFGFDDYDIDFSNVSEENYNLLKLFIIKVNRLNKDIKIFADCKDGSAQQTKWNLVQFKKMLEE